MNTSFSDFYYEMKCQIVEFKSEFYESDFEYGDYIAHAIYDAANGTIALSVNGKCFATIPTAAFLNTYVGELLRTIDSCFYYNYLNVAENVI